MQRLSDISTIRAVMEKNGFSFSKALGQNFHQSLRLPAHG